ncbi:hypothetical protein GQ53DRAFT_137662 [Thozetella sp. PMI_491]|nr:hypothetical protein GQ53DRAFT_137662 [Thozetella sp. PMI_491]
MAFKCRHSGCHRSYKRREHLLRHQQDHTNLRAFTCNYCSSAFNRRDLLNRHLRQSHSLPRRKSRENCPATPSKFNGTRHATTDVEGEVGIGNENELSAPGIHQLGGSILGNLGAELAQALNKELLQGLYFRQFHIHWPILNQDTFQSRSQPLQLVEAVMVAGLWMMNTAKTRPLAESLHDQLVDRMREYLAHFNYDIELVQLPRSAPVALLQTLMIAMILFTYRGPKFFPKIIVDNKRLFRLLGHCGVLDQERIDADNPSDWVLREQCQRLALVHFKVSVHFTALLTTYFPDYRLSEFLDTSMLKVRVPSCHELWDTGAVDGSQAMGRGPLIESLFVAEPKCHKYPLLSSVAGFDFSTGMILGCYTQREPGEPLTKVMENVRPFLFWHLKIQPGDWTRAQTNPSQTFRS